MPALTTLLVGFAVILSAIVSLTGTGARRRAVEEGRARASDLCELTGILEPKRLQDVFGPPTLDGFYNVTLDVVDREQRPLGRLMSDRRVDYGCVVAALVAMVWSHELAVLGLTVAAAIQTASWFIAGQLPKAR